MSEAYGSAASFGHAWTTQGRQLLEFSVHGEAYAVELVRVKELRRWQGAARLPGADPAVQGAINLRGAIVPIVDLRRALNAPESDYGTRSVVIVLRTTLAADNERWLGMLVDAVSDVIDVPHDAFQTAPEGNSDATGRLIASLATTEAKIIVLLDVDELARRFAPADEVVT